MLCRGREWYQRGGKCSELVENGLRVRVYIGSKSDCKWGIGGGGMN